MFDCHLHTAVSYDGEDTAEEMVQAAVKAGLQAICFTDHLDYDPLAAVQTMNFDTRLYNDTYDHLHHPKLQILRGMEFGMLPDNRDQFKEDLKRRHFDYVIGSVHFIEGLDIYYKTYWENKTMDDAERIFLEHTLQCVQVHDDFDVLGHLTYICKLEQNPTNRPVSYEIYREIVDEILQILVQKGKGLELNTSGMDRCGVFLPTREYLYRFKQLGGEIVTVGSDAHNAARVGQFCREACQMVTVM